MASANEPILNGGRPQKTKLNWGVASGDQVKLWAYNLDTQTISTGGEVKFSGFANIKFST